MSSDSIVGKTTHNQPCSGHYHSHESCHSALLSNQQQSEQNGGQSQLDAISDSIIRGNMQVVNGQLKKIPRPLNAFMIFSNEKRKELKREFPGEPNNMISSRLGAAWKALSDDDRKRYHDMAHREDLEHRRKYPNYQYCPGHARKLKKARKEQRMRQQGAYRASRMTSAARAVNPTSAALPDSGHTLSVSTAQRKQYSSKASNVTVKLEAPSCDHPLSSSSSHHQSASATHHSVVHHGLQPHNIPGPHGEGPSYQSPYFISPPPASGHITSDCMMSSCCAGCCSDAQWSADMYAPTTVNPSGFCSAYPPSQMMYCPPAYEPHYVGDMMQQQQCLMSGECSDYYQSPAIAEACFMPGLSVSMYPGGDACFNMPPDAGTPSTSGIKPIACAAVPSHDDSIDLTDISNNMVTSCSHDSEESVGSKQSQASISPSSMPEMSTSSYEEANAILDN